MTETIDFSAAPFSPTFHPVAAVPGLRSRLMSWDTRSPNQQCGGGRLPCGDLSHFQPRVLLWTVVIEQPFQQDYL